MNESRVTARIVKTADGETYTEYAVDEISFGSLEALRDALSQR